MLSARELEIRQSTIGSSDVPAVAGLSPWKGRSDVLKQKLDPRSIEDSPQFRLGHAVEQAIADEAVFSGKIPVKILVPGHTVTRNGWQSATPDFWGLRTGSESYRRGRPLPEEEAVVIECKNVGFRMLGHWDWGKKVPDYVQAQVQWQMRVLRHSRVYVAAFLGGAEIEVFVVERDDAWITCLEKECRAFWERHLAPDKRDKIWARVMLEKVTRRKVA